MYRTTGRALLLTVTCLGVSNLVRADENDRLFRRGDATSDTAIAFSDALFVLEYHFEAGRRPACFKAADSDDSGHLDLADPLYLLNYLFLDSPRPPEPFPLCGFDRTPDSLSCEMSPCESPPQELVNDLGMRFVYIPPGSFQMGSPPSERGRQSDEQLHTVHLTCGFFMTDVEVTKEWYVAVMDEDPSTTLGGPGHPVTGVLWHDAVRFCERLTERDGRFYRLPTEAEWEYACRAGTTTRFWFGDALECDDTCRLRPCPELVPYMRSHCTPVNGGGGNEPVGQRQPNAWGLRNMHGNVTEWCLDWYAAYPLGEVVDPMGPIVEPRRGVGGLERVIRGRPSALDDGARSAWRGSWNPWDRAAITFRIVHPLCRPGPPSRP